MPEERSLEGKTLLLVDGSSYLYRAYHAMPDLRGPEGGPTGALYGMINMLRRMRKEVTAEYSACVFDAKGKTFRDDWYADYKANRPSMPDDLSRQIEPIHVAVRALGWPLLMIEGVEADDVIGTLSTEAEKRGMKVIVSTGDKDLAQLVSDHVTLINTMTNEKLDRAGVIAKFGVPPERIIDYLSLIGDTVDNVPGVEKCGPKTAIKWLTQYETLDGIVAHADEIKGAVGDNLRRALDFLPMAKKLVTVERECDLTGHIVSIEESLQSRPESREELRDVFTRHGFKTWLREVEIADAVEGPGDRCAAGAHRGSRTSLRHRADLGAVRRMAREDQRRRADRVRYRNHLARSDDRANRGLVVVGRAGPCRLYSARASRPGRAGATAARRSAREAQAVARKAPNTRRSAST